MHLMNGLGGKGVAEIMGEMTSGLFSGELIQFPLSGMYGLVH